MLDDNIDVKHLEIGLSHLFYYLFLQFFISGHESLIEHISAFALASIWTKCRYNDSNTSFYVFSYFETICYQCGFFHLGGY